jgi:hypothetical protein
MNRVSRGAGSLVLLLLASIPVAAQSPTLGSHTVGSYTLGWYYSLSSANQGPALMAMLNALVNLGLRCREQIGPRTILSLGLGLELARSSVPDWQSANLMGVTLLYLAKAEGCAFDRGRLNEIANTTELLRQ